MGQVESCDPQWPEAAEHGEYTEAQVIPRGHHEEVVFALCVTRVVALWKEQIRVSKGTRSSRHQGLHSSKGSLSGKVAAALADYSGLRSQSKAEDFFPIKFRKKNVQH